MLDSTCFSISVADVMSALYICDKIGVEIETKLFTLEEYSLCVGLTEVLLAQRCQTVASHVSMGLRNSTFSASPCTHISGWKVLIIFPKTLSYFSGTEREQHWFAVNRFLLELVYQLLTVFLPVVCAHDMSKNQELLLPYGKYPVFILLSYFSDIRRRRLALLSDWSWLFSSTFHMLKLMSWTFWGDTLFLLFSVTVTPAASWNTSNWVARGVDQVSFTSK